ncbi:MAG: TetR/AcrR family transcriptional regulator [Actinobacteria bacterium]|nr:MAG: TetR/AcrR family transcriptional regulator [Actinomycetota bacterium]
MATATKQRIVERSAALFMRQGYASTGIKQIVAEAGAPFGSVYHFFPAGKEQLGAETIRWSGARYAQLIDVFFFADADPVAATRAFFAAAGETVRETGYADACPIATVALEVSSTSEPMREACAEVFESWIGLTQARLVESGLTPRAARALAISILASLEGAFVLARAARSTEPLIVAGEDAAAAVRRALSRRSRRAPKQPRRGARQPGGTRAR